MQVIEDFNVLGPEGLFFLCTLLKVLKQGISSFVNLALTIIDLEVVMRDILGLANLFGAQTLGVHKPVEVVMVGEYKHLVLRPF